MIVLKNCFLSKSPELLDEPKAPIIDLDCEDFRKLKLVFLSQYLNEYHDVYQESTCCEAQRGQKSDPNRPATKSSSAFVSV